MVSPRCTVLGCPREADHPGGTLDWIQRSEQHGTPFAPLTTEYQGGRDVNSTKHRFMPLLFTREVARSFCFNQL